MTMFDARGLLEGLAGSEPATKPRPAEPAPPASSEPDAGGTDSASGSIPGRADREWDRFLNVCVPIPGGGWRDPNEPVLRPGVTCEEWDALLATAAQLRQRREGLKPATAGQ